MNGLAQMILLPGEIVLKFAHIEGDDHQTTTRMLVNSLFWGFLAVGLAFIFAL